MARMWMLALLLAFVALQTNAAEGDKPADKAGARRGPPPIPYTMDYIKERLGADNALTDDQAKKVEAANAEFQKKMDEANKKEGVAAAQEAMKKAREDRNWEDMKAASTKLTEAMGFDSREEYKKALTPCVNEAQLAKLFPARRNRGGGGGGGGGGGN
jgi:hypothetical protein